jgi:hypothetical protein
VALADSELLLRFTAERIKDLDPSLIKNIAEARAGAEAKEWTPDTAQKFWNAFSKICDLIRPVTLDSLRTAHANLARRSWPWSQPKNISLAERTSSRYMKVLVLLLIIILPLQLYVWVCTSLSKRLDELNAEASTKLARIADDYIKLSAQIANKINTPWTQEENALGEKIRVDASALYQTDAERVLHGVYLLDRASKLFLLPHDTIVIEPASVDQWYEHFRATAARINKVRTEAQRLQENSNILVGIVGSFILPVLFGTMGAAAFIIRHISEQIRTSTFLPTSPIRHAMRVVLGALAGVVVGLFGGLTSQLSLQPLAIAFLGGYGTEAIFSMFDGFIERFRQK